MWQPNNLTKNTCTRLICERVLYLKIAFARIVEPATIGGLRFLSLSDMCSQAQSKGCVRSLLHLGHIPPENFRCLLSRLPILRFFLVLSLRYIGLAWVVLPKVARRSERLDLCSPVVPASPQIQHFSESGFTSSEVPCLNLVDRPDRDDSRLSLS